MAAIRTRAVRALTDRQTDRHTDKQTTVTLLRMRRGLIRKVKVLYPASLFNQSKVKVVKGVVEFVVNLVNSKSFSKHVPMNPGRTIKKHS